MMPFLRSRSIRSFASALLATFALTSVSPASAVDHVGIRQLSIPVADRGTNVDAYVLYPADDGGTREVTGELPGFFGAEAWRDAPIAPGKHPLIVISHGSGGSVAGFGPGLGWLTTRLAAAGYIVVGPNHPGTMTGDSDQKKTVELWHRPLDLSATIDAMLVDPAFSEKIDPTRIGALGFSLGGYDVLALAGAEQRRKPFAEFCFRDAAQSHGFCDWIKRGGVDLAALDPRFEANHRDPRVKAIVAVDPAFTQSYDETSLGKISVPVQFLNLGTQATTPSIVEAHGLAEMVPGARIARVPDAVHFSFLVVCKPEGAKLLKDMGEEEEICSDGGGRDRPALHDDMLKVILGFLAEALPSVR